MYTDETCDVDLKCEVNFNLLATTKLFFNAMIHR